MNSKLCTV